jgi:hypothetical protein
MAPRGSEGAHIMTHLVHVAGCLSHTHTYTHTHTATYGKEAPTLTLDQRDFLPPPPKDNGADDGDEASCWCVLYAGRVVWCALQLCVRSSLPPRR